MVRVKPVAGAFCALLVLASTSAGPIAAAVTPPPASPAASVSASASASALPTEPADPTVLLRSSVAAPKTVSYVGQFESVRFASSRASATIVKVEHRAPTLTRRWYVAPEALYGDYVITRGSSTYQFDTKGSKLTVTRNAALDDPLLSGGNFNRILQNYRAIYDADAIVADRPTASVSLINKYTGERAVRVWIDRQTHLVLKKEEYHANGAVAAQTRFEDLRYTTSIPDDIFSIDAPAGFSRVAGPAAAAPSSDIEKVIHDAGFTPYTPKVLPQGFNVVSGDVAMVNGVRTLHLLYSDGLRSISLFENATGAAADFGSLHPTTVSFEGHDGQYVEDGPTTLLTWKEHDIYFALVGDLLRPELIEIAKSVVP
jgi:negative regulator of sigma E activity